MSRLRRVFFGWWIVTAGMGVQALTAGLLFSSYGAYLLPLQADLGWSKATFAGASSLQQVESGLLGPIQGWLLDRFGTRSVILAGIIILGIGFILWSWSDSVLTFYLSYLIMSLGASLCGYLSLATNLVQWFVRRRSTVMGMLSTGMSLGTALVVPLVALSLETNGWRTTAFASGLIVIALAVPLTRVMHTRPEDHGLQPDGDSDERRAADALKPSTGFITNSVDYTPGEAFRTSAFWLISIGHAAALLVVATVSVHLVAHVAEVLQLPLQAAAVSVTVITVFSVIGQVGGGIVGDRYDKRVVAFGCMIGHASALLLLAFAADLWLVGIACALHGVSWGVRGPMMASIRADYFGRAHYGTILGTSSIVSNLGGVIGPLLAGFLYDQFGNYQLGFTVLAVMAGAGSLFFLLSPKPRPPKRSNGASPLGTAEVAAA